jgi:hypothetical protein
VSEPVLQQPDGPDPSGSAAVPKTQAVKEVKSYRVRELPPPPKAQEEPAAEFPIAAQPASKREWRPPWYRAAVPSRWKPLCYAAGLALLVLGTALAVWNQAMRPGRGEADVGGPIIGQEATPRAANDGNHEPRAAKRPDARDEPAAPGQDAATGPLRDVGARQVEPGAEPTPGPRPPVDGTIVAPRLAETGPAAGNDAAPMDPLTLGDFLRAQSGGQTDWLQQADSTVQGKLNGRTPNRRVDAVRYGGATSKSELAVEAGLRWLVAHQRDDGSWRFNHITDACMHYCTNPGTEASTTAATGLALLPFLGAGYTHKEGEYQDAVQRGLDYLRSRAIVISYGNDLRDGSMYGQGLATIALCEAYGMTHDPALKEVAQGAINFVVYAQDAKGGGWRYTPGEPGDTTVTGWMLMALKSGQMAGLNVSTPAIFQAERFLSSVQNTDGSQYGYMTRQPKQTTTAVALLCRMYTGWQRDNPGLKKGMGHLTRWGPSETNLYYDYYATQAMFHFAGPGWEAWNRKMRDHLVGTQGRGGHEAGSWYFRDPYGDKGGRLYNTAMAAMVLEVYYRYMPLYSETAVDPRF